MTARRRPVATLVAVLVTGLAAAGCGVPTSSEVEYIGPGPEEVSGLPGEGAAPPGPDEASNAHDQVTNFLRAAAGSPDTAVERLREFIRPSERQRWRPDEQVRVIRLLDDPYVSERASGGWQVELTAQQVGELTPRGYLDAPTSTEPVTYRFRVVSVGGPDNELDRQPFRLRIADPPPYLLLTDTALTDPAYFYPHPIYFWDADHRVLVPDLRWLPLAGETADQHPWTVVRWLLEGPSPGLRAQGLPAGAQPHGTPVWDGNRLVVAFNAAAVEGRRIEDLATQLAWSLLHLRPGAELELRIDDRTELARIEPPEWESDPVRFAVLDGVVRPYAGDRAERDELPPVLTDGINSGIDRAAISRNGRVAALVRPRSDGQRELSVAVGGQEPVEEPTGLVAERFDQPVWLGRVDPAEELVGLVVADGRLYRFTSAGRAEPVSSGLAGSVTSVSVSPEQRRLALIADDQLYLAQLRYDTQNVTVQGLRPVPTTVDDLTGVAFRYENQLVIAGRDERTGLYQVSVDGAIEERLQDLGNATVTTLVAHPTRNQRDPAVIMYEADGQAFTYTALPSLIHAGDLVDSPEETGEPPGAPFFLG